MATGISALKFTDLNYDCFRAIFSYLSPLDAYYTIDVFGPVANEAAYKRISRVKDFTVEMRFPPPYPMELLYLIGQSIERFHISVGYSLTSSDALSILRPICTGAVGRCLNSLSIKYIYFDEDYLECILPLAKQIKHLDLANCQLTDIFFARIMEEFTELIAFVSRPNPIEENDILA